MEPAATQSSRHQYKPLEHENAIRLLKVPKPCASSQQPREFSLIHTTIDSAPRYETVSYVWGNPVRNHNLVLNDGTTLPITENLDRAIHELAHHCSTGYLWIDHICINQDDTAERNHQVRIMGEIYKNGHLVLVWLGSFDLPSCSALDSICATANNALGNGLPEHIVLEHLKITLLGGTRFKNRRLAVYEYDLRMAICQLVKYLASSWFVRGWVFQEIILSPQSKIIISSSTVSLEGIYWICEAIREVTYEERISNGNYDTDISIRGLSIVSTMRQTWQKLHFPGDSQSLQYPSFPELLSAVVSDMQTSLPQDRIYAFMGLNMYPNIRIEPDYAYSGGEVMVRIAKSIIQGSRHLDIFEYLCRSGDGDNDRPFVRKSPTWVPDFTSPTDVQAFSRSATLQGANGRSMYPHRGRCDLNVLVAHGKFIDSIQSRIDPRYHHPEMTSPSTSPTTSTPPFDAGNYQNA